MASYKLRFACWLLAMMSGAALAQDPAQDVTPVIEAAPPVASVPAPSINLGVATIGDLDRIQSEIIVAQARLQLAQTRQSLAKAQGTTPSLTPSPAMTPVVAGVFGTQAQPYAKFLLGDGGEAIGRPGDVLPGGFLVTHVGVDKVVIKDRKGKLIIARFSSTAPSAPPAEPVVASVAQPGSGAN